jgi:hypothetical protein
MNGKGLPDKAFSRFVEENVEEFGQVLESVGGDQNQGKPGNRRMV